MPKKKRKDSQEEESERFEALVRKLAEDGELSPTDADAALDKLVRKTKG